MSKSASRRPQPGVRSTPSNRAGRPAATTAGSGGSTRWDSGPDDVGPVDAEVVDAELVDDGPLDAMLSDGGPISRAAPAPTPAPVTAAPAGQGGTGRPAPVSWGWQGVLRRVSRGLVQPAKSAAEQGHDVDCESIRRDFGGPRTIVFINPRHGVAKTTAVLAAAHTFGTARGGGVVAWDATETRSALAARGARVEHRNTARELLDNASRFERRSSVRPEDLTGFVRPQGDGNFDVLAAEERPDAKGRLRAPEVTRVHRLLEQHYQIILIDTGDDLRSESWLAATAAADLLVLTSTVRIDRGHSGLWMLDALSDAGHQDLRQKTVTVLAEPSAATDRGLARNLAEVYGERTRAVFRVPYDPILVGGGPVPYGQLSTQTRRSWQRAVVGMAEAL